MAFHDPSDIGTWQFNLNMLNNNGYCMNAPFMFTKLL